MYRGKILLLLAFAFGGIFCYEKINEKPEESKEVNLQIESKLPNVTNIEEAEPDKMDSEDMIRVLLMTTGYGSTTHDSISVHSDGGLKIQYGDTTEEFEKETLTMNPEDARCAQGVIRITPLQENGTIMVESIERGYGTPDYDGTLEVWQSDAGLVLINELSLEDYLCKVVPSEMPATYELEALKAQAVCARSYAKRQMGDYAYPEYQAHVNDSTEFQVYNNSPVAERSTQAVRETAGQVVWYQGSIATTYYYSTSSGKTTNMEAWGNAVSDGNEYLQEVSVSGEVGDYEKDLPWYQWKAVISKGKMKEMIESYSGKKIGEVTSVEVTRKGAGGVALELQVAGTQDAVTVRTENKIRTALGGNGYEITKNDGTVVNSSKLLPSAFFNIERQGDDYVIQGGGYGHGIGMSQNGANEMAKAGKTYKEILEFFYQGVEVK